MAKATSRISTVFAVPGPAMDLAVPAAKDAILTTEYKADLK